MTTHLADRNYLLQEAEALLRELSTERLQRVVNDMTYYKEHAEPEDELLVRTGILPRLVEAAVKQPPAADWEQDV